MKVGIKSFYVENGILYVSYGDLFIEVEMVRKTPRYEVRYNGVLVSDSETSQNDIIKFDFYIYKKYWYYCICEDWFLLLGANLRRFNFFNIYFHYFIKNVCSRFTSFV